MPKALIWGASGGIGGALVQTLKANGWQVFAAARDESRIPAEADHHYPFEAGKPATIAAVTQLIAYETDTLDFVIYAAGGLKPNPLDKLAPDDWEATFDANLNGAFHTGRASLDLLPPGGQMIFLGAYVDKITLPRMGAYAAAKAGLETLVTIFQKENRKLKITLARLPAVDTPFWQNVPFKLPEYALQPQAVAEAILKHYEAGEGGTLNLTAS